MHNQAGPTDEPFASYVRAIGQVLVDRTRIIETFADIGGPNAVGLRTDTRNIPSVRTTFTARIRQGGSALETNGSTQTLALIVAT